MATEKDKSIDQILANVQKALGKNCVRRLNDPSIEKVPAIPTGSMLLDKALGVGGLPRGRIVEIFGEPSNGKTTVALSVVAQAQKAGLECAFIDAEQALDVDLARGVGVDVDKLILSQPDYGEHGLEIADMLVKSGAFGVIVIDSVAALIPKAELEGSMEDQQMGLQARMLGKAIRKLTGALSKTNTCIIFINQTRAKLGTVWGNPTDTPGGKALKFFASIRLDVKRIGSIKQKDEIIGNRLKIQVTKNKLAPPFRTAETDLIFGKGFDRASEIIDTAIIAGVIEKKGPWFYFGEEQIGQGKQAVCDLLNSNEKLFNKLVKSIEKVEK